MRWVHALPGTAAATYGAGPTGFGLYRARTAAGVRCQVAAPSKLQRPSGDRVKTDQRDALHLARLLRPDEVTPVTVPSMFVAMKRSPLVARLRSPLVAGESHAMAEEDITLVGVGTTIPEVIAAANFWRHKGFTQVSSA